VISFRILNPREKKRPSDNMVDCQGYRYLKTGSKLTEYFFSARNELLKAAKMVHEASFGLSSHTVIL
jgi:hypothetical protein